MEAVKINEIHRNELPFLIEIDESKCIQCGRCSAVCSFNAIKPAVELRKSGLITGDEKVKKVLVIDNTVTQKAKYIVPVINPTKAYVTEFEGKEFKCCDSNCMTFQTRQNQ